MAKTATGAAAALARFAHLTRGPGATANAPRAEEGKGNDATDERVENTEEKVDDHDDTLKRHEERLDDHEGRISRMEGAGDGEGGDTEARARASGATAERQRCAAIFEAPEAAANVALAAHLAFHSAMPATDAIAALRAAGPAAASGGRAGLAQRMSGTTAAKPGAAGAGAMVEASRDPDVIAADFVIRAAAKARGEKVEG